LPCTHVFGFLSQLVCHPYRNGRIERKKREKKKEEGKVADFNLPALSLCRDVAKEKKEKEDSLSDRGILTSASFLSRCLLSIRGSREKKKEKRKEGGREGRRGKRRKESV